MRNIQERLHDLSAAVFGMSKRLDYRKPFAALIALVLLLATNAQANIIEFRVVQSLSKLTQTVKHSGWIFGGGSTLSPQFAGSDVTSYVGGMFVDIQDNTIQLMPGASITAAIGAPGAGGVPGLFAPFDPVVAPPSLTTPGLNPNSNYGWAAGGIVGQKLVQYGVQIDNGAPSSGLPSTPMQRAGIQFNLSGQGMSFSAGREASTSTLLPEENVTRSLAGETFLLFGTDRSDIGTWDGVTLTLPVHSVYSFLVTNEHTGVTRSAYITGQLVLVPVPEPSSVVLAALGLIGLAVWGWRSRKR